MAASHASRLVQRATLTNWNRVSECWARCSRALAERKTEMDGGHIIPLDKQGKPLRLLTQSLAPKPRDH